MSPTVVVGIENKELLNPVLNRLQHPSLGFECRAIATDGLELVAILNTAEADILIIDQHLPKLSKSMVKSLIKNYQVIILVGDSNRHNQFNKFKDQFVELAELAHVLGLFRTSKQIEDKVKQGDLVVVAAVASGSGASTIAINLAYAMTESKTVCLADFDFTHPSLISQLNHSGNKSNLRRLSSLLPQLSLTPAELAEHCLSLTHRLRLLPGIQSAFQSQELDFESLDEIVEAARELDSTTILDLGQLQFGTSIGRLQKELIANSQRFILVTAADPISLLTTCNWLSNAGSSYLARIEVVINKYDQRSGKVEIANLIQQASNRSPVAYFPRDEKTCLDAIWSGEPIMHSNSRSKFGKSFRSWVGEETNLELIGLPKNSKSLARLKEVS